MQEILVKLRISEFRKHMDDFFAKSNNKDS